MCTYDLITSAMCLDPQMFGTSTPRGTRSQPAPESFGRILLTESKLA